MISPRRLLKMARRWQKLAAMGRRRISWLRPREGNLVDACGPWVPSKGTFVVYSRDGGRFVVPLEYINTGIFKELFELSKEEFGLPCNGPIVMTCDAALTEYVISLLHRRVPKDVEQALLSTVAGTRCSTSSMCSKGFAPQHLLVHGF